EGGDRRLPALLLAESANLPARGRRRGPGRVKSRVLSPIAVMTDLESAVEAAWESRASLSPQTAAAPVRDAIAKVIADLDRGRLRVAEKRDGTWTTHQWIKKAVLLSFRLADNAPMRFSPHAGSIEPFAFYDKVPTKFAGLGDAELA